MCKWDHAAYIYPPLSLSSDLTSALLLYPLLINRITQREIQRQWWTDFQKTCSLNWKTFHLLRSQDCYTVKKKMYFLVTCTWSPVKFALCIWPVLPWGAVGNCCAAPRDQIQIFTSARSRALTGITPRIYVFDCAGNRSRRRKPVQTQG